MFQSLSRFMKVTANSFYLKKLETKVHVFLLCSKYCNFLYSFTISTDIHDEID